MANSNREGKYMTIKSAIVGAAGFAGVELVRVLLRHPAFELSVVTSNELAGIPVAQEYPCFTDICDLVFTTHDDARLEECDLIFLAVPHTAALKIAPIHVRRGAVVVDLSADFRLRDASVYEAWYNTTHTAQDLLSQRAFGLPELFPDDLKQAHETYEKGDGVLVGCAGCYPTATSLAAAPALRLGMVEPESRVVVDAISGVTGAGKKCSPRTHFCFDDENFEAYGVATHRHTPEIEQILDIAHRLVFTPHLAPANRGLLSTVTLSLSREANTDVHEIQKLYKTFYQDSYFVHILPCGQQPKTSSVAATNHAHIGVAYHEATRSLIATCAIDNLGKGAASQAVQCANIVFGLDEKTGLDYVAIPVI